MDGKSEKDIGDGVAIEAMGEKMNN